MERIASGFALAEAPTVDAEGHLLVSDVLVGGVRRFRSDGSEIEPLLDRRRGIGGMGRLPDGRIVVSGRDLAVVEPDGALTTIAAQPEGGTGVNDLTIAPDGTLVAGVLTSRPMAGEPLQPAMVLLLAPDGTRTELELGFGWPNGIGFSPEGDRFLIADFDTGIVHSGAWPVDIAEVELVPWAASPTGDADGLAVTDDGDVWVAGGSGGVLLRYDSDGTLVGSLDLPDDFVSSVCPWPAAGALAITTGTGVFLASL